MHVLDVQTGHRKLMITVETDADQTGCRVCGVVATGHGRRRVEVADAPCFGLPVLLICSSGSGAAPSRPVRSGRGLSSTT
jgi:transposase